MTATTCFQMTSSMMLFFCVLNQNQNQNQTIPCFINYKIESPFNSKFYYELRPFLDVYNKYKDYNCICKNKYINGATDKSKQFISCIEIHYYSSFWEYLFIGFCCLMIIFLCGTCQ